MANFKYFLHLATLPDGGIEAHLTSLGKGRRVENDSFDFQKLFLDTSFRKKFVFRKVFLN
jgi:hypothetical protein